MLPAPHEDPPLVYPDPFDEFMDFDADPLHLLDEPLIPRKSMCVDTLFVI